MRKMANVKKQTKMVFDQTIVNAQTDVILYTAKEDETLLAIKGHITFSEKGGANLGNASALIHIAPNSTDVVTATTSTSSRSASGAYFTLLEYGHVYQPNTENMVKHDIDVKVKRKLEEDDEITLSTLADDNDAIGLVGNFTMFILER